MPAIQKLVPNLVRIEFYRARRDSGFGITQRILPVLGAKVCDNQTSFVHRQMDPLVNAVVAGVHYYRRLLA